MVAFIYTVALHLIIVLVSASCEGSVFICSPSLTHLHVQKQSSHLQLGGGGVVTKFHLSSVTSSILTRADVAISRYENYVHRSL